MHPLIVSTIATHIVADRHETAARERRSRVPRRRPRRRAAAAPVPSVGRLKGATR
jgi:hypothetical protein